MPDTRALREPSGRARLLPAWHVLQNVLYMLDALTDLHPAIQSPVFVGVNLTAFSYPCHDDKINLWDARV